jgi:membrane glycosyltransferase
MKEHDTAADIRYIIIKGIENWFLTGDTNDPDSIVTVVQIGWFQVLKGYIPKEWTSKQEVFYRRRRTSTKY